MCSTENVFSVTNNNYKIIQFFSYDSVKKMEFCFSVGLFDIFIHFLITENVELVRKNIKITLIEIKLPYSLTSFAQFKTKIKLLKCSNEDKKNG